MNISNLPDYSALKRLASALWQEDNAYHGAAVMVGAGFSRSAASAGDSNSRLPIWSDLSKALASELETSDTSDPLRLAEEYCAYFGRKALHDRIEKEVNDPIWAPGQLHKNLLELPWSEVLTTNWDTLLERASMEVHQPVYSVVSRQEDLANARSPRIVKLHGTINTTKNLVFSQEDYRAYPQSHAAFVNFARQVFIENELCLLGFSGDDPNFLQWAGWVRDHLASHARRIYLTGALHLTPAKRKYLESINVAPIDLSDLVTDYDDETKHLEATKIFLRVLLSLKPKQPWDWSPTSLIDPVLSAEEIDKTHRDSGSSAALLDRQLQALETDRKNYPGWIICPSSQRWQLQTQISNPFPTPKILAEMPVDSRIRLLYEIAWRHRVTYEATPLWMAKEMLTICDPKSPCVLTKRQQLEVALQLLKNARWLDDHEYKPIEEQASAILMAGTKYWPDAAGELALHQAIVARDSFAYPALLRLVDKIPEKEPEWKLKKASVLAELGEFDRGKALIAEAYRELINQHRCNRNSIYIFSRLSWAHWLMHGIDPLTPGVAFKAFPSIYEESGCGPWAHIEQIQERVSKALMDQQKQREIEPLFEPGHYRDNSDTITFNNTLHPLLLLEGITSSTGIPLRWNNVSFLVDSAGRLAELDDIDSNHRFALAIRAAHSDTSEVLKKIFSRTNIARMSRDDADYLLDRCTPAIEYWNSILSNGAIEKRGYAMSRLRVFMEVLARVSVRATPEQAKGVFLLACSLGKRAEFHHFWLFDALRHLFEYSLASIPETEHHQFLLEALSFPLQSEVTTADHKEWPNPAIKHPGARSFNTALDRRIDEIIDRIEPLSPQSAPALLRLLPLLKNSFLTTVERRKIADKIWGHTPDYHSVPETGLLKYVLLSLPSLEPTSVKDLVRRYLFEAKGSSLLDRSFLTDVANAAQAKGINELPSADQAEEYFNRLTAWRVEDSDRDPFGFTDHAKKQQGELIGQVIGQSVVPALPSQSLTEENFEKLKSFYDDVESYEVIFAFPYFAVAKEIFAEQAETIIRRGLRAHSANTVAHSAYALLKWREMDDSPVTRRLIMSLISLIGTSRTTGLAALLWTADKMYLKGYLSGSEIDSLAEILPVLFDNSGYKNIPPSSQQAVSASLVRAASARLARHILNNEKREIGELLRVLEEARQDALPEVRFAELVEI